MLGHRGKLRKLDADYDDVMFVQQLMCLRLAVILCHARRDPDLKGLLFGCEAPAQAFALRCRPDWAAAFVQSATTTTLRGAGRRGLGELVTLTSSRNAGPELGAWERAVSNWPSPEKPR